MKLSAELREEVEDLVGTVQSVEAVAGGCVSSTARVRTAKHSFFLKFHPGAPESFFAAESAGLGALRAATTRLLVPEVIGFRDSPAGRTSWILVQWLEPAAPPDNFGARLGSGLAEVHSTSGPRWGSSQGGFIGPLEQSNGNASSWGEFWWSRRLEPQLRLAEEHGQVWEAAQWDRLRDLLPELLAAAEREGPRLLHGDLWSGNVLCSAPGVPALIDPACYFGHREVDLAMTELFGGFQASFYQSYRAELPLAEGYQVRRGVYQLFYLLVHVNLFGTSYLSRTLATLQNVLTEG
jgi:protein-ribulosamine 3-kinase